METTILTAHDVRSLVLRVGLDRLVDELISGLEEALCTVAGDLRVPAREGFSYRTPEPGLVEWMPCHDPRGHVTCKIVGYHPRNPSARGLPTILSTLGSWDARTGHLRCLADGTLLTALRTGAASAVATRILARSGPTVLGIIGCGAQAVAQVHATSRVLDVREILFCDTDPRAEATFAERVAGFGLAIEPRALPLDELVRRADLISTQTTVDVGAGPVFPDLDLRPWVHVNAVGSDFPGKTEAPLSLLERALVCPDFPAQALREGECQVLDPSRVGPSLAEIVREPDTVRAHREGPTVFDSTGWALEDHVALELFLRYASELGIGRQVELECIPNDPRDPYAGLGQTSVASSPAR